MPNTETHLVHADLSYRINGILYDVYNELGSGYREQQYENAVAAGLQDAGLAYERQLRVPLEYKGRNVGDSFLDFCVEQTVVLELKQGNTFSRKHIEQVHRYLKAAGLQLGIIAQFGSYGVRIKRVVNLGNS